MRTLHETRREPCQIGSLAVVAVAAAVLLVATGGDSSASRRSDQTSATTWRGLVSEHDAQVAVGQRMLVLLGAPSLADRVARAGGRASEADQRKWTRAALVKQRELLSRLAQQGVSIDPEFTYARVVNGFAAALDPRAVGLLERAPEVAGVFPVRIGYPASTSRGAAGGSASEPPVALPGFDGRGVTIALLDTGVDRAHPALGGRVRKGIDILTGDRTAAAEANPDDPALLERHGTEMAGILVGNSPERRTGVAPGASVMPIRIAGWQRNAEGAWAIYSRTDQLIAGLERAVDPNGDGDAHDGARVTLVGVGEPYAAFADGPGAAAVEGAYRLDSLVVVPAGNDGAGGPGHGVIAGPGGAPAALTVGAADLRARTAEIRVVARTGLEVRLDRVLPLTGAVGPGRPMTLRVGAPRGTPASAATAGSAPGSLTLREFFDGDGLSLVAGRAAIIEAGDTPQLAVERAVAAGAHAVLLYGDRLPAGALGLDEDIDVPVIGIPRPTAMALIAALGSGGSVSVSLGAPRRGRNTALARMAGFSSHGLAFDGRVKPELAGPGVAVPTSEPGVNGEGAPRYGTVNGSSAAAAAVAGAAALIAQARRGVDARALRGLLVGSARPLLEPVVAQGAGLVDVGAAAAAELAVEPAALALPTVRGAAWRTTRTVRLRNLSARPLRVSLEAVVEHGRASGLKIAVTPARLHLRPHGEAETKIDLRAPRASNDTSIEGVVRVTPTAGMPVRVPWAVVFRTGAPSLLGGVRLSPARIRPSDAAPAVLELQVGRVLGAAEVQAVSRLEITLFTAKGQKLGLLTRVRNLLPGNYVFGLTGRGPGGQVLGGGRYRARILALPTDGGRATRRSVEFTVIRR
ncbi:MAG: S8 family serine peptidase [Actinobacteria bacterium]|nr:S8 family serine peptidase [Actinomycetota bacterium]